MIPGNEKHQEKESLRERAENRILKDDFADLEGGTFPAEMQRLIHELQVHQIELELQNEQLRQTQVELVDGLKRYTELYDFAPMGLWTLDRQGAILKANLSASALLGMERARLLDFPMASFVSHGDRPALKILLDKVFSGSGLQSCEMTLNREGKPSRIVTFEATLSPDGEECRAVGMDITDRKSLEQQLLRSQRLESIGTLAGGIAHDLNNSLGPIPMALELLKSRAPDASSRDLIQIVDTGMQRAVDLVKQILVFARGVKGRRIEVPMAGVIREIENFVNETCYKHILVKVTVPPDLWTVLGDPTQLHQILLNLCINARDAMPTGGEMTIWAENRLLDEQFVARNSEAHLGPYIVIHVEDTGVGISDDIVDRIFDPFFSTKEVGKGTGLGLSTSMGIVQKHDGFIEVSSELNRGSTFSVFLPAEMKTEAAVIVETKTASPRGLGELILVVDDEASVRLVTQIILETYGYRVVEAASGEKALEVYAEKKEDIAAVFTDMMMPNMDGAALIQQLRKISPKLPILVSSGVLVECPLEKAKSLDVAHFLSKPYKADILLRALRDALDS